MICMQLMILRLLEINALKISKLELKKWLRYNPNKKGRHSMGYMLQGWSHFNSPKQAWGRKYIDLRIEIFIIAPNIYAIIIISQEPTGMQIFLQHTSEYGCETPPSYQCAWRLKNRGSYEMQLHWMSIIQAHE